MLLNKHKLYNLIKREIHILTTKIIIKKCKYIKFIITFNEFLYFEISVWYATSYIYFNVHNQTIIYPLNVEQIME